MVFFVIDILSEEENNRGIYLSILLSTPQWDPSA